MIRYRQVPETQDNLDRWLLTYADMITLLTAVVLILYSMSVMSSRRFAALAVSVRSGFGGPAHVGSGILPAGAPTSWPTLASYRAEQPYAPALRNLRAYVATHQLTGRVIMRENERGLAISVVSDELLFNRGTADLRPASVPILRQIARILATTNRTVQIEGHTCDLPIHTRLFPSNWELSSARAGAVLRFFTDRAGLSPRRFLAAGYADTRPLVPNTTEANRARNRRVDIVLLKTG